MLKFHAKDHKNVKVIEKNLPKRLKTRRDEGKRDKADSIYDKMPMTLTVMCVREKPNDLWKKEESTL